MKNQGDTGYPIILILLCMNLAILSGASHALVNFPLHILVFMSKDQSGNLCDAS